MVSAGSGRSGGRSDNVDSEPGVSALAKVVSGSLGAMSGAMTGAGSPKGGSSGTVAVAPNDGEFVVEDLEQADGTALSPV